MIRFRMTTLIVYGMTFVGMLVYTFSFTLGRIEIIYVTASLLG